MEKTSDSNYLNVLVSAAIGGGAGAYLCFPFEGLKKRLQTDQKISFLLTDLYRGSTAFAASVTLATVAAMSFEHLLKKTPGYDNNSTLCKSGSAVASGMLGAVVGSTPVENVILTQQLHQTSPVGAIRLMMKQGIFRPWVGLPELALREAGFAGAMLWGVNAAREKALSLSGNNKTVAELAGLSVGVFGAAITQPFDTVATIKQKSNGILSSSEAFRGIYITQGLGGFFKGLSQRVFLFTGCAYTIPAIQEFVYDRLASIEA